MEFIIALIFPGPHGRGVQRTLDFSSTLIFRRSPGVFIYLGAPVGLWETAQVDILFRKVAFKERRGPTGGYHDCSAHAFGNSTLILHKSYLCKVPVADSLTKVL